MSRPPDKFAVGVALLCSATGVLMQALDSTIVLVAMPHIQGSLSASHDQITWILTSYIVVSAIMTAPVGWLANRFGTKIVYGVALLGFTAVSGLCGMALTLDQMVVFRALQGAFGAALTPLSLAILLALFPAEKRSLPIAIWSMAAMVGPIAGPTLGGILTEYYDWRWCFYVNLPIGMLAAAGLWFFFREEKPVKTAGFDGLGFGVLAVAVGAFQLMLDRGIDRDWFSANEIVVEAVLAGLGAYLFLFHMVTAKAPFVPRALFRDRNFVISLGLMYAVNGILFASISMMPTFLQSVSGRPVLDAGLLLAPRGFGVMAGMLLIGKIASFVDPRAIMSAGAAVLAWSLWEMAHWPSFVGGDVFLFVTVVQGFAMGLLFAPLMVIAFVTLEKKLQNDGTAFISLIRNLGSAAGISAASVVLANGMQTIRDQAVGLVTPFNQALSINAISKLANFHLPSGAASLNGLLVQHVAPLAYGNVYIFLFYLTLALLPPIWLYKRPAYSTIGRRPRSAAAREAADAAE